MLVNLNMRVSPSCQRVGVRHFGSVSSGSLCRCHKCTKPTSDGRHSWLRADILDCLMCTKWQTSAGTEQTLRPGFQASRQSCDTSTSKYVFCGKCISPFPSRMREAMSSYEVCSWPSPNQTLARREAPAMMVSHCFRKLAKSNNAVIHTPRRVAWSPSYCYSGLPAR